ncbi:sugar transferase [Bacteroidota bacterium]
MVKRFFDFISALFGLLILSPLLIYLALLIKLEDGGPIFYRGLRVGINGKLFKIYKFRSMIIDAEKIGPSSTTINDHRQTRIGKFLRRYKFDEMPQLLNILFGQMSFVGPRPQVQWAVELYSDEEKKLLTVKPGITDYSSIKFKNEAEILKGSADPDKDYLEKIAPEKLMLGLEYVKNRNLWVDIKIIFATIKSLVE